MLTTIIITAGCVIAGLIALEKERQRKAKHRGQTSRLLTIIDRMPVNAGLERNVAARWVG